MRGHVCTDQGPQFTCFAFTNTLKDADIRVCAVCRDRRLQLLRICAVINDYSMERG
jgi:hypothetical protein